MTDTFDTDAAPLDSALAPDRRSDDGLDRPPLPRISIGC